MVWSSQVLPCNESRILLEWLLFEISKDNIDVNPLEWSQIKAAKCEE